MDQSVRADRLRSDLQALEGLRASSSIFAFEPTGQPPDRYLLIFRGGGLGRDAASGGEVTKVSEHRVEARLPYTYPEQPPDVRWLSPIFHPNISFSGFVNLPEVGLAWHPELGLDAVCERLWDVARLAFIAPEKAVNYAAKNWLDKESPHSLPIDARPLRDRLAKSLSNVVRYERRGDARVRLPASQSQGEILFIDEDTPAPPVPPRAAGDDDVLYIGPE